MGRKQRKHRYHHGTRLLPNKVSNSLLAKGTGFWHFVSALVPCARFPEEPGAVIPHAGICEGAPGNRCPYLNRLISMKKMTLHTIICTVALVILAIGLARVRDGYFVKMLEENLMIFGGFSTTIGFTMMFASNGPIGRAQTLDRNHSPTSGVVLLISGIVTVGLSVWIFNHPMLLR